MFDLTKENSQYKIVGDRGVCLLCADCLDALTSIKDNSVDAIVTDPPAGIAFMNKDWDKDKGGRDTWIVWLTDVMIECRRVLKPNGKMLVWAIPRTSHWTCKAIEKSGMYIKGKQYFIFGSGFPKSHNISKAIDKKFGAKRDVIGIVNNTYDGSVRDPKKHKSPSELSNIGEWGLNETPHGQPLTKPATKEAKRWDGYGTALKPSTEEWIYATKNENAEESSGFYYGSKAQVKDRNEGIDKEKFLKSVGHNRFDQCKTCGGYILQNPDRPSACKCDEPVRGDNIIKGNHHPTVKSADLMKFLCGNITDEGGIVLDPFMGSGSTGKACLQSGYQFIGIEKEEEYFEIAKARIDYELDKPIQDTLW